MSLEGVIKFQVEHEPVIACAATDIVELERWRSRLRVAGLMGQTPKRYEGYGYGNLSRRMRDGTFLITASQTGQLENLTPHEYVRIIRFDASQNCVWSKGMKLPSSESMTHLAAYGVNPKIQFVFHAHCPQIWNARVALEILTTNPAVEYGTREMFHEVQRLLNEPQNFLKGILAMGGHVDGLLAWGETADAAGANFFSRMISQPPPR